MPNKCEHFVSGREVCEWCDREEIAKQDAEASGFDDVLDAFAEDADEALISELRQLRSDPGTGFDDALSRMTRRLAHLRGEALKARGR